MKQKLTVIALCCALFTAAVLTGCAKAQSKAAQTATVKKTTVALAKDGKALLPVVVSNKASEKTQTLAQTLADYLHKMSGGTFTVQTSAKVLSPKTKGITVGIGSSFAGLSHQFDLKVPTQAEDYLLQSHKDGLLIAGATDLAVQHAVWDFLYQLGYRQFFPGKDWEIIPHKSDLSISVNTLQHPDYFARTFATGYRPIKAARPAWEKWEARNRMGEGISLNTSHAYGAIIRRHKAEFKAHPEYLAKPGSSKFCVSNPGLQKLVINDALAAFAKNPQRQSYSLEPSDGGGWKSGTCADAKVYKTITDRVVALANIVAKAVNQKYPNKYVGIYAYNTHSPPPTIALNRHVIPSIATSFMRKGFTVDELIKGWGEKANYMGIREFYSVGLWNKNLPGRAKSGNLDYVAHSIGHFHDSGARFMTSSAGYAWGPNGLGTYLASRLLWNTKANVSGLKADFFHKAFGSAKEPMKKFYQLINGANKSRLSHDLMGRMYRQLDAALKLTDDPAIQKRINDLALYTHYVELYYQYSQAKGKAQQAAFEHLLRYTWRIGETGMVHAAALWIDLARLGRGMKFPEGSGARVAASKDPWKSSKPYSPQEIRSFITKGIANNKLLAFTPVSYSDDLVPATSLHLSSGKPGYFGTLRGKFDLFTWINKAPSTIDLTVSAGRIYQNLGPANFELFPSQNPMGTSVAQTQVPPDKAEHTISLKSTFDGLQRIAVSDAKAGTRLSWSEQTPMTLNTGDHFPGIVGRWAMYFYVPKGTKIIGGYRSASRGRVENPEGKTAYTFTSKNNPGYWSITVPAGQDGKLWKLSKIGGGVKLLTVPPYVARSAQQLLLPKEVVVAADAGK